MTSDRVRLPGTGLRVRPRHLHGLGMLVRDLKTDNVVLSDEGDFVSWFGNGAQSDRGLPWTWSRRSGFEQVDL